MKRLLPYITICILWAFGSSLFAQDAPSRLANEQIVIENFTMQRSGNQVLVSMNLTLDSLKLKSERFMAFTPVIEGVDGETAAMRPLVIAGRRQHIIFEREGFREYADGIEVRRYNGKPQQVEYVQAVNYQPWMSGGNLRIIEDLCGCGKPLAQSSVSFPIFDYHPEEGIFVALVVPEVQAQKVRFEEGSAYLDFPVNKTVIYPDYRRNPIELHKIINTINVIKDDPFTTITSISIHGYASPEGSYANNTRLAAGRAEALKEYVRKQYTFADSVFHVQSTPEDWAGLRQYVVDSELTERSEILAIIDGNLSPDAKDQEIKKRYPATYKFMLDNWYPALRHSDYVVQYVVRPFNVDEAKELLFTRPQLLSLQEMFMVAQTYPVDSNEYLEVFETAARLYPTDTTANLNVAIAALNRQDLPTAERYLKNAGNSPQAIHAQGVLLMRQGQLDAAQPLIQQAVDAGVPEAANNLEILLELKKYR